MKLEGARYCFRSVHVFISKECKEEEIKGMYEQLEDLMD